MVKISIRVMDEIKNIKEEIKASIFLKIILSIIATIILIVGISGFRLYKKLYIPNVQIVNNKKSVSIFIPTGSTLEDLMHILSKDSLLRNIKTFEWTAKKKDLENHIHPGRYILKNRMNNKRLIELLRTGKQRPVKVIFHNIRTKEQLAQKISQQIEADDTSILRLLNDTEFLSHYKLTPQTSISIFIPNTYEFYWNSSAEYFFKRMYKEYLRFWNNKRIEKTKKVELTQTEIITLASIVDEETLRNSEMSRISGVYMNRLRKRIPLQADPTIKFALNDFSIKRIRKKHLTVNSPYNTYKHYGLPPGPIAIPSIAAIDAVLNYEEHQYLYFCAKEDFSGYHNFAKTLKQHNINAFRYRRALNKNKIFK